MQMRHTQFSRSLAMCVAEARYSSVACSSALTKRSCESTNAARLFCGGRLVNLKREDSGA